MRSTLSDQQRATLDRGLVATRTPVMERRLRGFEAREQAGAVDSEFWTVHVDHSSHDAFKVGVLVETMSKVVFSREDFTSMEAEQAAFVMGCARGTYPSAVRSA